MGSTNKGFIIIAVVAALGAAILFVLPRGKIREIRAGDDASSAIATFGLSHPLGSRENAAFDDVKLEAQSVMVLDVESGATLFAKDEQNRVPLASLTKIMTAIIAIESIEDSPVLVRARHLDGMGDQGLIAGETWRVHDLIDFTLVTSSNDGALALADVGLTETEPPHTMEASVAVGPDSAFVRAMNAKARSIGLLDTFFLNPTGLDANAYLGGAYGSAADAARLVAYAVRAHADMFEATRDPHIAVRSVEGYLHREENTNEIVHRIPGLIASKTGYTDLAGGNLAIVFDAGLSRPIAVVVLGSTQEGRFSDVLQLVQATLRSLRGE